MSPFWFPTKMQKLAYPTVQAVNTFIRIVWEIIIFFYSFRSFFSRMLFSTFFFVYMRHSSFPLSLFLWHMRVRFRVTFKWFKYSKRARVTCIHVNARASTRFSSQARRSLLEWLLMHSAMFFCTEWIHKENTCNSRQLNVASRLWFAAFHWRFFLLFYLCACICCCYPCFAFLATYLFKMHVTSCVWCVWHEWMWNVFRIFTSLDSKFVRNFDFFIHFMASTLSTIELLYTKNRWNFRRKLLCNEICRKEAIKTTPNSEKIFWFRPIANLFRHLMRWLRCKRHTVKKNDKNNVEITTTFWSIFVTKTILSFMVLDGIVRIVLSIVVARIRRI